MRWHLVQRLLKPPSSSSRLPLRIVQAQCKTATASFSQSHRTTYQHQPYKSTTIPHPTPVGPPRSARVLRPLLWAVVFGITGFGTVAFWMAKAFKWHRVIQLDTIEDARLVLNTLVSMRTHPVVQALFADPEFEPHFPYAVTPQQEEAMILSATSDANIDYDPHFVQTALRGHWGHIS